MLSVGAFLNLLRNVDKLISADAKYGKAIEKLEGDIQRLADRVTALEAREDAIIVKVPAAASGAATQVAIASVSDIARRIGRLEERSEPNHLKPPD